MNAKTRITRENLITRDFVIRSSFERFLPLPSLRILSRAFPAAPPFQFVSSRRPPRARPEMPPGSRRGDSFLVPSLCRKTAGLPPGFLEIPISRQAVAAQDPRAGLRVELVKDDVAQSGSRLAQEQQGTDSEQPHRETSV